jgi:ribosomal protein S17E
MGKIKSRMIKRTGDGLIEKGVKFDETFEKNKKILGNTMPSKKMRNRIAGYLARVKTKEKAKQEEMEKAIKV